MVDAELTSLALHALLRSARVTVHLLRITGIGMDQDELAEVVHHRGDHQAVARLVIDLGGDALDRALRRGAVQAEALRDVLPHGGALEEVVGPGTVRERQSTVPGESTSTAWTTVSTWPRPGPSPLLARRITAIVSARSPSTARIRSAVAGSPSSNRRSTRLRVAASIGNASSASNAAVSRRPWPSL